MQNKINNIKGEAITLGCVNAQVNNMEMCQKTCTELLRFDKDNDGATVMMADLSYRRNQYDTAMFHFQQLLGLLLLTYILSYWI